MWNDKFSLELTSELCNWGKLQVSEELWHRKQALALVSLKAFSQSLFYFLSVTDHASKF